MKNYLCKSLLGLTLLLAVSCVTDEVIEEEALAGASTSLLSEPSSTSRVVPSKGSTYYIKNVNSGLFLDVEGARSNNGRNIYQWSFTGAANQQWKLTDFDGNLRIEAVHSGKSLEIADWSKDDKGNVEQYDSHNGANQKFQLFNASSTRYFIKSKHSNKFLGIASASKSNQGNVEQYKYTGANYQKWAFYKVD